MPDWRTGGGAGRDTGEVGVPRSARPASLSHRAAEGVRAIEYRYALLQVSCLGDISSLFDAMYDSREGRTRTPLPPFIDTRTHTSKHTQASKQTHTHTSNQITTSTHIHTHTHLDLMLHIMDISIAFL